MPDTIRSHSYLVVDSVGKGYESSNEDGRAWQDPAEMGSHLSKES